MRSLSRLPVTVQRMLAEEAACEMIYYFANGAAPSPIVTSTIASEMSTSETDEKEWTLLYDVMKVERQKVLFEEPHLERIRQSYQSVVGSALPEATATYLKNGLRQYIAESTTPDSPAQNVKLVAWLRADDPSAAIADGFAFVLFLVHSFFPPAEWYRTGTNMALLYNARRENPNAKVVHSELRARAAQLQRLAGVFEVLLVHDASDGHLIPEGSRSNYLLVNDDGAILCSAEEDILVGITLRAARRATVRAGLGEVQHRKLTLRDLCAAKSLVMLGTSPGTLPVREVLVYTDAAAMTDFEAAARHCGVDVASLQASDKLHSKVDEPQRAALRFDVSNPIVERLMKAYGEEALE